MCIHLWLLLWFERTDLVKTYPYIHFLSISISYKDVFLLWDFVFWLWLGFCVLSRFQRRLSMERIFAVNPGPETGALCRSAMLFGSAIHGRDSFGGMPLSKQFVPSNIMPCSSGRMHAPIDYRSAKAGQGSACVCVPLVANPSLQGNGGQRSCWSTACCDASARPGSRRSG